MKIHDINERQRTVILLLHPLLGCAELMKIFFADRLGINYRFIIPDITGCGDEITEDYVSAKEESEQLLAYLKEKNIEKVHLAFAADIGAVILMELMNENMSIMDKVFFEGASFTKRPRKFTRQFQKSILKLSRYAKKQPDKIVDEMEYTHGEKSKDVLSYHLINVHKDNIKKMCYDLSHVNVPRFSLEKQKYLTFAYGEQDPFLPFARKIVYKRFPKSRFRVWKDREHCKLITEDDGRYFNLIIEFLNKKID